MRTIGAVYVWILIVLLFSIISPATFPTATDGQVDSQPVRDHGDRGPFAGRAAVRGPVRPLDRLDPRLSGVLIAYLLQHTGLSPVIVGVP